VRFRHFLKVILQRVPGFGRILRMREQLRDQARAIDTMRVALAQAEADRWQAIREREQAVAEKWEAVRGREQADAEKWDAIRQREQAEAARWQAVREREASDNARGGLTRQLEQVEQLRWQAVREREHAERTHAQSSGTPAQREPERRGPKPLHWRDVPQLEKQELFVFGQTRSGTTVLTRALNTCPDIMLLSEANLHAEGMRNSFARWFNDSHRQLGGTDTKGTYCPIAPEEYSNGPETMQWLGQRFRYVGDKIALRGEKLGYNADECFAFHARHFFSSHYVCVIRNPADVLKSNKEMLKAQDLSLYADSYLQALLLILAFAETLPNVHVLFHESIDQRTFGVLAERLGVDLAGVYEANYHKPYQAVGSRGADHTGLPWLMMLGTAHQMMRDAFSLETLREMPNHPTWMMLAPWIREMREKLHTSEPKHLRIVS